MNRTDKPEKESTRTSDGKVKEITFDKFIRSVSAIIIMVLIYLLLRRLSNVLIPFFVAWLVAYMLYPIVCFFQYKCKLKWRALSIVVTLLTLIGIIFLAGWLIIPPIIEEYTRLQDIVVSYVSTQAKDSNLQQIIEQYITPYINIESISKMFTFNDLTSFIEVRVPQIFSFLSGSITALIGFVASLISIIYMFFILMDYENMSNGLFKFLPKNHRPFISGMLRDVEQGMNSYFRGQSLIALCVGVLFAFAFWVIDFPMAIPLGLFMGFLNLVPYLQTVGFIPAIILALLKSHDTGQSFWAIMLAFTIAVLIVQAIQDWFLTPKIMGSVTGLNGAVILLSLSIWGTLLGFVGLIIALPATTLIISYYRRYILREET